MKLITMWWGRTGVRIFDLPPLVDMAAGLKRGIGLSMIPIKLLSRHGGDRGGAYFQLGNQVFPSHGGYLYQ
jgi:hypothetical protein